jgi:signal transduction histidine kinase
MNAASDKQLHIVLIEDSPSTRRIIIDGLSDELSCRVTPYVSGEQFFADFNFRTAVDVFIVDNLIYGADGSRKMDGCGIVSRIKGRRRYARVPVVMLSTAGDEEAPRFQEMVRTYYYRQKISGLEAGADDVIYKPHGLDLEDDPDAFPMAELVHKISILVHRRELQVELTRMNLQLRRKNRELHQLNENYLQVLSFVSHEFRNALVVIGGFLRRLKRRLDGDADHHDLDIIISNCEFMEDMIDRYLILSRIEMGRLRLNPVRIDDFATAVIEPVLKRLGKDEQCNRIVYDGSLPLSEFSIEADRNLLQVVFSNLFSNAFKYGDTGKPVHYGIDRVNGGFRFHVRNAGTGIAPRDLKRVFQKFLRLRDEHIPEQKGVGLGLYNVKEIVELHGGRIWVESNYGEWADFFFILPDKPPAPADESSASVVTRKSTGCGSRDKAR